MDDHDSKKMEAIRPQGIMLAPYEVAKIFGNRFPFYRYLQRLHSKRGDDDNEPLEEAFKPVVFSKKLNKYADYRRISGKRNGAAAPAVDAGKVCRNSENCKTSLVDHSRLSILLKEDAKRNEYSDYRRIAGKRNIYSDYRRIAGKRSATNARDASRTENIISIDQDQYNVGGQGMGVKESGRIVNDEDWTVKFIS